MVQPSSHSLIECSLKCVAVSRRYVLKVLYAYVIRDETVLHFVISPKTIAANRRPTRTSSTHPLLHTHKMHKRQHGKSASARPQKKVRLADTATTHRFERNADSDRDDDDDGQLFETAVEQSLEKSKRQLAHRMRLDGYGSDDASSAGDSEEEMDGENLNARVSLQHHHAGSGSEDEEGHAGEKSGDEDDDLFAEKPAVAHDEDDDDLRPQRKGASSKKAKQLALNDIEGQEDDPDAAEQFTAVRNVADDDDGDDDGVVAGSDNDDDGARKPKVIKIEPFNMRTEMEEGGFDEEGAYIENKDVDRHHDNWLHGVSAKDIRKV